LVDRTTEKIIISLYSFWEKQTMIILIFYKI
jgi:hypothetical protein